MLKFDGWYEIYAIQLKDKLDKHPENTWRFPKGLPEWPEEIDKKSKCYRLTGIFGAFKYYLALQGIKQLRKRYPNKEFRIVFLEISQFTKIIKE